MTRRETEDASTDLMLTTVHNLAERRLEIDWQIRALIHASVEQGATWAAVGAALGCSSQAAWHKYRAQDLRKIMAGQDTLPIDE